MRPDKKIKKKLYRSSGDSYSYGDRNDVKKVNPSHFDKDLPSRTAMAPNKRNYPTFKPLLKFLKSKIGQHWDKIYSEIVQRIPYDVRAKNDPIDWYVALNVTINPDKSIFDEKKRRMISLDGKTSDWEHFYVHPVSKVLHRLKLKTKPKLSEKEIGIKNAEIKKRKADNVRLKKERKKSETFDNILRKKYGDD